MTRDTIKWKLERSSLGTRHAVAARKTIPTRTAAKVVARAEATVKKGRGSKGAGG